MVIRTHPICLQFSILLSDIVISKRDERSNETDVMGECDAEFKQIVSLCLLGYENITTPTEIRSQ